MFRCSFRIDSPECLVILAYVLRWACIIRIVVVNERVQLVHVLCRHEAFCAWLFCHIVELFPRFLRLIALIPLIDAWQVVGHRSLNLFGAIVVRRVCRVLCGKGWLAVIRVHTLNSALCLCIEEVLAVQVVASCHGKCLLVFLD